MLAHLGPLPYLVLLQVGFTMPALLPRTRCALTAPFHPCRLLQLAPQQLRRFALCCTFRRLAPPRRYLAPDPPEPGLSSTPDVAVRSSDHLAGSPPPTIRGCARKSIFRVQGVWRRQSFAGFQSSRAGSSSAESSSAATLPRVASAYASLRVAPVSYAAIAAARLGGSSFVRSSTARRNNWGSTEVVVGGAP
jgi:hypothetical protein